MNDNQALVEIKYDFLLDTPSHYLHIPAQCFIQSKPLRGQPINRSMLYFSLNKRGEILHMQHSVDNWYRLEGAAGCYSMLNWKNDLGVDLEKNTKLADITDKVLGHIKDDLAESGSNILARIVSFKKAQGSAYKRKLSHPTFAQEISNVMKDNKAKKGGLFVPGSITPIVYQFQTQKRIDHKWRIGNQSEVRNSGIRRGKTVPRQAKQKNLV